MGPHEALRLSSSPPFPPHLKGGRYHGMHLYGMPLGFVDRRRLRQCRRRQCHTVVVVIVVHHRRRRRRC